MEMRKKSYPEIGWFNERFTILEITKDSLVFDCEMGGKGSVPPHFHSDVDEEFTALQGNLAVKLKGEVHVLEPGNSIVAPKGEVHSLKNPSEEKIRFKVSMVPNLGISSLFEILLFLREKHPEKNYSIFTALYILDKLKLKEFGTPVGIMYYVETTTVKVASVLGPMLGWSKLADEFSRMNLEKDKDRSE